MLLEYSACCFIELFVRDVPLLRLFVSRLAVENKLAHNLQLRRRQGFNFLDQLSDVHYPQFTDIMTGRQDSRKAVVSPANRAYLPRLMPKSIARSKTRKAVSKRFKITGTGKVLRQHASRRHLLSSKSGKLKRHMAKSSVVDKTDVARIKMNMPFA